MEILVVAGVKSGAVRNVIMEKHNFREYPFKFWELPFEMFFFAEMTDERHDYKHKNSCA